MSFTSAFGNRNTQNTTLSASQIPSHAHGSGSLLAANHDHNYTGRAGSRSAGGTLNSNMWWQTQTTSTTNSGSLNVSGNTSSAGSGNPHNHGINLAVQYVDFIIAQKD